MAIPGTTLSDLQTRIITEVNRDDLGDVLANQLSQYISDAIDEFANERFWFNEMRVTGTFPASVPPLPSGYYTPLPSGYRTITDLFIRVGNVEFWVKDTTNEHLEHLYTIPQYGQPILWAPIGTQARLWPSPNVTYPSIWLGVFDVLPYIDYTNANPSTNSNYWTTEGQWLISARVRKTLYRNVFKDTDGEAAAQRDEDAAYSKIKALTNQRLATGYVRAAW